MEQVRVIISKVICTKIYEGVDLKIEAVDLKIHHRTHPAWSGVFGKINNQVHTEVYCKIHIGGE